MRCGIFGEKNSTIVKTKQKKQKKVGFENELISRVSCKTIVNHTWVTGATVWVTRFNKYGVN